MQTKFPNTGAALILVVLMQIKLSATGAVLVGYIHAALALGQGYTFADQTPWHQGSAGFDAELVPRHRDRAGLIVDQAL